MGERVAVLGTGIMGAPMARNLLKAGFQVRVWNRTPDLDRAQPIFDAIGSNTVRLEPETGRASRMRLVVSAWTVGILESLRAQLSRGGL
jgi:3-hydroxyisobutyrate dehydrogenase